MKSLETAYKLNLKIEVREKSEINDGTRDEIKMYLTNRIYMTPVRLWLWMHFWIAVYF